MVMRFLRRTPLVAFLAMALFAYVAAVSAQNTNANIANTRHNLSASNPIPDQPGRPTVKATSESQICVFCHTPHAANAAAPGPLWNRQLSGATYTPYISNSLDAATILGGQLGQPGGSSKLCLSCHDGTLALGTVSNAPGSGGAGGTIAMGGAGAGGTMPAGDGLTSGYTRNLGTDLRNDHPISFTYNPVLAAADGELRTPPYSSGGTLIVGSREGGARPLLPLDHNNHVQCTTCHDPHLDASKFLRLNRLQTANPTGGAFSPANDQICLGCHDKLGQSWSQSAHANPTVADEAFTNEAADRREFPRGTRVWEAACLSCHDTHAAQGTRRLLRDGVAGASSGTASGSFKLGSSAADPATSSAIEETCYQCHRGDANRVIGTATGSVPNILTEFDRTIRKPIISSAQGGGGNTTERHNIRDADFMETPEQLGLGNHANRHVECTDCHNPHRVLRNSLFNGQGSNTARTHVAGGTATNRGADGNVASGALRGTWGVEPNYGNVTTWPQIPLSYVVKKGDPGTSVGTERSQPYLTREYQLCFKCHSDYGGTSGGQMPPLGYPGGTPSGTMGLTRYTNIAAEFAVNATDPPSTGNDQGENSNDPTFTPTAVNHRSWHPVVMPTGRTPRERTNTTNTNSFTNIRAPFNTHNNIGYQTMQCSDCHGANATGLNEPTVQGPHGSANNFLLKGPWSNALRPADINATNSNNWLCGRCHNPAGTAGGFSSGDANHDFSAKRNASCTTCHIAIPHGWKNKAFLVNLLCVQSEGGAGYTNNCTSIAGSSRQTIEPYYFRAGLRIQTWQRSTAWTLGSCSGGGDARDWMTALCESGGT